MTPQDIKKIAIWTYNASFEDFCKGAYGEGQDERPESVTIYLQGKYADMKRDAMAWIGQLDSKNIKRLADTISRYEG